MWELTALRRYGNQIRNEAVGYIVTAFDFGDDSAWRSVSLM
jgi:hypothetical protein